MSELSRIRKGRNHWKEEAKQSKAEARYLGNSQEITYHRFPDLLGKSDMRVSN